MRCKLPLHSNIRNNSKTCSKQVYGKTHRSYVEESVPSEVYEAGSTSSCGIKNNDFILIDEQSNKVFHMPTVTTTKASVESKIRHNLRESSRTVNMVPSLKHNSLVSASKFTDANYITVLTWEYLLIFDGNEVNFLASGPAILTGWRYKTSVLWRVPLKPKV